MDEAKHTHNPFMRDDATGRRKTWMTATAIVLAVVAVAGIAYSVYTWQQNQKLSADVTAKNNQIADLQKKASAPAKTTPSTQPADPYAGWQSTTLKYEKLDLRYPSTWTISNSSTQGAADGITPGSDYIKLVSPTGLKLVIYTGDTGTNGGPFYGTLLSVAPIATMNSNLYIGFATGVPAPTADAMSASIGTTSDKNAAWPVSKNITSKSGAPLYNIISMFYSDASNNSVAKPVSAFQSDSSYNDALLIIKSLSY